MREELNEFIDILEIPKDTGYWLLRADGGKYYDDFFLNDFIAISDNEITLSLIRSAENASIAGTTIEHYKYLYREIYTEWSNQQMAHAASRTEKFYNEMKTGDLVLVPSKRSQYFLIGIITSNVFEVKDDEVMEGEHANYAVSPYLKRRKVTWIKEVSRDEISVKLYWVLSAHQTIFNLIEQKEYINQLLSPIYVQDGLCHGTIKISKEEGLNSNEWYELHSLIKHYTDSSSDKVIIKSNVQSPGLLEFISENLTTIVSITIFLSGVTFGEINILGVKLKGILPYYQSHRKNNLEADLLKEEIVAKKIDNERASFELQKEKEIWEETKKETEVDGLRQQLNISSFDAGKIVGVRTQVDNLENPNADEP